MVTVKGPPVAAVEDAASVKAEFALPPAGGVTVVGENVAVTPLGSPAMLKPTALAKPFRLPTVTVSLELPPWVRLAEAGETLTLKSGCAAVPTVMVRVLLWLIKPALPVIFTAKVPVAAEEDADTVRMDEALPPAGGVTVDGLKDAVTPVGNPERLKLVAALKPFTLPTVTVVVLPVLPLAFDTVIELGETAREKSGAGLTVRLSDVV
jgi:hypothetical protein